MRKYLLIILLLCYAQMGYAQIKMADGRYKTLATIIDGDTIPLINLAPVEIIESVSPEAAANLKVYLKLRRDVLRAYPYAKLAETS